MMNTEPGSKLTKPSICIIKEEKFKLHELIAHRRFDDDFKSVISEHMLWIKFTSTLGEIAIR